MCIHINATPQLDQWTGGVKREGQRGNPNAVRLTILLPVCGLCMPRRPPRCGGVGLDKMRQTISHSSPYAVPLEPGLHASSGEGRGTKGGGQARCYWGKEARKLIRGIVERCENSLCVVGGSLILLTDAHCSAIPCLIPTKHCQL